MARIPTERLTVGPACPPTNPRCSLPPPRRFRLCLFMAGVLFSSHIGLAQSPALSGSQSGAQASPTQGRAVSFQILDQKRVFFGHHSITLNRVAPPVFPAPVPTPTPAPVIPTPVPYDYDEWLCCGATVYDNQYTVVQDFDGNQGLVAVSNINFNYFSFIEGFIAADTYYEVFMYLFEDSAADADPVTAGWLAQASGLPAGTPGYVVVSGTPTADDIQALDALHTYVRENAATLQQQYSQQQAQYAAYLLQLKLHPPVRPNTVINYWPIKTSVYLTGSSQ